MRKCCVGESAAAAAAPPAPSEMLCVDEVNYGWTHQARRRCVWWHKANDNDQFRGSRFTIFGIKTLFVRRRTLFHSWAQVYGQSNCSLSKAFFPSQTKLNFDLRHTLSCYLAITSNRRLVLLWQLHLSFEHVIYMYKSLK